MSNVAQLDPGASNSAVRGLATVAMLKANFDDRRDPISMFEPFVRDAVATCSSEAMDLAQIQTEVISRHELTLPVNTMRTLLQRLVKRGYLRRDGGRYFRTDKALSSEDVLENRRRAEKRQRRLADALIASAAERGVKVESTEDALALVMSFMESYHVKLAFDEPPQVDDSLLEDPSSSPPHVATAIFLREAIVEGGELSDILQEMLEGFVLQNTLLLKDIAEAGRQFKDLQVIADSQILFGALGLRGPAMETATLEFLELLKKTGATLSAFEPTIKEMRQILIMYEEKLSTPEGRESLHPTDLTQHFFAEHFTPADVRQRASLIELRLSSLGINVRELPERAPEWTLDERSLARALADESGREDAPRVVHDVDCVAGVLTYRKGRTTESLDSATAIFVTNSGMTVGRTRHWYREQGGLGFPPIIHWLSLSNYAWLKRPASAAKLKVHELVALCTAALRPSRASWERFVKHLRDLERTGELSSDEVAAVVASGLTQNVLAEEGIDEESDAASISEVVERLKATYRQEADAANAVAEETAAEVRDLRIRFSERAASLAHWISLFATGLVALSLIVGTAFSVIVAATGETPPTLALVLATAPLAVLGLLSILSGFHLKAWRRDAEAWIAEKLEGWMLHGRFCPDEADDAS